MTKKFFLKFIRCALIIFVFFFLTGVPVVFARETTVEDVEASDYPSSELGNMANELFAALKDQRENDLGGCLGRSVMAGLTQLNDMHADSSVGAFMDTMSRIRGYLRGSMTSATAAIDIIKDYGKDFLKGKIKEAFYSKRDEKVVNSRSNPCEQTSTLYWDKKNFKLSFMLDGDCMCKKAPVGGANMRVGAYSLVITADLEVELRNNGEEFKLKPTNIEIYPAADCDCVQEVASAIDSSALKKAAGLTPESPFYFLDTLAERISLFFTVDPVKKINKTLAIITEKQAEAALFITQNNDMSKVALDRANIYQAEIKKQINKMNQAGQDVTNVLQDVNRRLERNNNVLMQLENKQANTGDEASITSPDPEPSFSSYSSSFPLGLYCGLNSVSRSAYVSYYLTDYCDGDGGFTTPESAALSERLCTKYGDQLKDELEELYEEQECPSKCPVKKEEVGVGLLDICHDNWFLPGSHVTCAAHLIFSCEKKPKELPPVSEPPVDGGGDGDGDGLGGGVKPVDDIYEPAGPVSGDDEEIKVCSVDSVFGCRGSNFFDHFTPHEASPCLHGDVCLPYNTRGKDNRLQCFCYDQSESLFTTIPLTEKKTETEGVPTVSKSTEQIIEPEPEPEEPETTKKLQTEAPTTEAPTPEPSPTPEPTPEPTPLTTDASTLQQFMNNHANDLRGDGATCELTSETANLSANIRERALSECQSAINQKVNECAGKPGWSLDTYIAMNDILGVNAIESEYHQLICYGGCDGTGAGDSYPLNITSEFIDIQHGDQGDTVEVTYEIVCRATCNHWECVEPCGDGTCDSAGGENCSTCLTDCGCDDGQTCQDGQCVTPVATTCLLTDFTCTSWTPDPCPQSGQQTSGNTNILCLIYTIVYPIPGGIANTT